MPAMKLSRGEGPGSLFQMMMDADGQTIELQAHREPHAIARDGQEVTISADTFDELVENMRLWFGTRLMRHHRRTGRGAHNVSIEVTVKTGGPLEMGGELPGRVTLDLIDGRYQLRALQALGEGE
jgi:hypothetical protein